MLAVAEFFVALGLLSVSKRIGGPDVAEHGMTGKNEREKKPI